MSAALNARADTSTQSAGTVPDISLGSFTSTFSTPARSLRIPSTTTGTTARRAQDATPVAKRQVSGRLEDEGETHEEHDGDVLDTPDVREKKWGEASEAATPGRHARRRSVGAGGKGGINLTLRDQEKVRPAFLYVHDEPVTKSGLRAFMPHAHDHYRCGSESPHAAMWSPTLKYAEWRIPILSASALRSVSARISRGQPGIVVATQRLSCSYRVP
ncbi:hypothetical protein C8Q79DRAFT_579126 [Trametes meyenii]|nr:hypothetical protein C8Q79DRAFT_579126 [Trametes meyenii]